MKKTNILLENINRQRKLMGLNESAEINEFVDVNDTSNNVDEVSDEDSEDSVIEDMDTLNELKWFKDKINKLRNRFNRSNVATPSNNKSGAMPVDAMDRKIANDISGDLSNAEDEYPDNNEYPENEPSFNVGDIANNLDAAEDEYPENDAPGFNVGDISNNLDAAESEYPPVTPSMKAQPSSNIGQKAVALKKQRPGSDQPIKTSEPILGMGTHPTADTETTAPIATPKPGGISAASASNPGANYNLNYNVKPKV